MIIQVSEKEWSEIAVPFDIATIPFNWKNLESKFDLSLFQHDGNGLGAMKSCIIEIDEIKFWLMCPLEITGEHSYATVSILSYESDAEIALNKLLREFGISKSDLSWFREKLGKPQWVLYRIDDNANEIEMYRFHEEICAKSMQIHYKKKVISKLI